MAAIPYRGRFAPSPTGGLHLGSLVTAIASYLDAKAHNGTWLLRIEDVDTTRTVSGSAQQIIATLDAFGLRSDEPVYYQTGATLRYDQALQKLQQQQLIYSCHCSRKSLQQRCEKLGIASNPYPGFCRSAGYPIGTTNAIRCKVVLPIMSFRDKIFGYREYNSDIDIGDFVIRRNDGLYSYQLAVVVDDAQQSITDIVRGYDLIDSTPLQLVLQEYLNLPKCSYLHLPLIVDSSGQKLSKQNLAPEISTSKKEQYLFTVLTLLGQQPPTTLLQQPIAQQLQWAVDHWDRNKIPAAASLTIPSQLSKK